MENIKIAVALRAARTALGWSQQEFADKMKVAKSTIARIETVEVTAKADFLVRAFQLFQAQGVIVDIIQPDKVALTIEAEGLQEARSRLQNEVMRRSDRKSERKENT